MRGVIAVLIYVADAVALPVATDGCAHDGVSITYGECATADGAIAGGIFHGIAFRGFAKVASECQLYAIAVVEVVVVDEAVVQISGGGVDGWADAADTTTEYNPVGATYVGA